MLRSLRSLRGTSLRPAPCNGVRVAMKVSGSLIFGMVLGTVHFLLVGVPFILARGGGEGLMFIIIVDLPLFMLASLIPPISGLMYNSVAFNFVWFCLGGTFMYGLAGYWVARLIKRK